MTITMYPGLVTLAHLTLFDFGLSAPGYRHGMSDRGRILGTSGLREIFG